MNIALLIAGITLSASAQITLKYSAKAEAWGARWFAIVAAAAALYCASFVAYSFLLRREALSRISPLMGSAVALLVVLAGVFLFGETLTARRGIGIVLGLAAILLLAS